MEQRLWISAISTTPEFQGPQPANLCGRIHSSSFAGVCALLWSFRTGDRAGEGLNLVYGKGGDLFVELNDPRAAIGACCSYEWLTLEVQSRLVSVEIP
jgi:hypothetical protein